MIFRSTGRQSDPRLSRSRMDAPSSPAKRLGMQQKFVSTLYTLGGIGLFFGVWWVAASQLPRSRLVTPLEAGRDLWTNFFYSPRLGVFGLGKIGYGSLLLYTLSNVFVGLVTGGVIGVLIGIASAVALSSWVSSLLYGVTRTDPTTFATVSAILILVALAACYIPARRAAHVDPMIALRHD